MAIKCFVFAAVIFVAYIQTIESSIQEFDEIGCKGRYETAGWAKIDRIIQDCYNLYRNTELFGLSR